MAGATCATCETEAVDVEGLVEGPDCVQDAGVPQPAETAVEFCCLIISEASLT